MAYQQICGSGTELPGNDAATLPRILRSYRTSVEQWTDTRYME